MTNSSCATWLRGVWLAWASWLGLAGWPAGARASGAPDVAIRWLVDGSKPAAVEVSGIPASTLNALERARLSPEAWAGIFSVAVESGEASASHSVPPMAGAWTVQNGRLRFEPRFPLTGNVRYRAEFRPARLPGGTDRPAPVISFFQLPEETAAPTTAVAEIYPTAHVLPENQLKFYVQFSAPMSGGAIYQHVHLRDEAGREIELPFLGIDEELWDPTMSRLTLLIDPGRIKRGVKPLVDIGAVFETGGKYSLTIDAAWRDASGRPLRTAHRKEFRSGPADRTPPDPARWTVTAPAAGTRAPLIVAFDEPMDHALALRLIAVADAAGEPIEGAPALVEGERRWTYVPAQPWRRGAHQLVVPTTIEDLAGNNIGKVFDVDLFDGLPRRFSTASLKVVFEVK